MQPHIFWQQNRKEQHNIVFVLEQRKKVLMAGPSLLPCPASSLACSVQPFVAQLSWPPPPAAPSTGGMVMSGLQMLWTMEAPARREATMTTDDHARDGVPVGTRPPPNLLPPVILLGVRRLYQMATKIYCKAGEFVGAPICDLHGRTAHKHLRTGRGVELSCQGRSHKRILHRDEQTATDL